MTMHGPGPIDRTMILKGTTVHSTQPGWPTEGKPAGRAIDLARLQHVTFNQWEIVWASGSGGYWRWVKREDLT